MKISLLYPPFMDPRAPQLALPSLAAFLRKGDVTVTQRDLALEGLLFLTSAEVLDRCGRELRTKSDRSEDAGRALRAFDHAAELALWALGVFRSEAFYDSRDRVGACDVLTAILRGHTVARDNRVACSLYPSISYDIDGYHTGRFRDLVTATAEPELDLFDAFFDGPVAARLEAEAPDLVGITITNHQQWLPGLTLARKLKARGHFVVLGGGLISKFSVSLGKTPDFFRIFADSVVAYEGETALAELVREVHGARRLENVPNLLYLDGDTVRANAVHVEDVNALPTPDFDGLPIGEYLTPSPVLPMLTGKGCYFNRCKFCEIPFINHVSTKPYRIRRPDLIVNDVRTFATKHGAKHFVITDEACSPKLLLKLADGFRPYASEERYFTAYARLEDGFTREVVDEIADMGIRKLYFGMESASQAMIDHMDKGTKSSSTPRILRDCRDAGIRFHLFSIIGLPEETEAMARETYQFFVDNQDVIGAPGNSFDFHPFQLELHTEYFKDRERYGIEVNPECLAPEFLVGLRPTDWKNTRGLASADVHRLVDTEFNPGIVELFRRTYGEVYEIWPGSEEYAVLYGSRYDLHGDCPYRATLPEPDGTKITLRVNPAASVRKGDGKTVLELDDRSSTMRDTLIAILTRDDARSVNEVLSELAVTDVATAARNLDVLVRVGFFQLRVESPESTAGVARRRPPRKTRTGRRSLPLVPRDH